MPIDNQLFGVWKTFIYGGTAYIVETANESVAQEAQPKYYIMGTAMPRILSIQGAEANLEITAPLLVCEDGTDRTGLVANDPVKDGLTLIKTAMVSYMDPNFNSYSLPNDAYMIFKSVSFSVSADQGATYKISAVGDYDSLASEGNVTGYGFGLDSPTNVGYPLPAGTVYRVGAFYDFDVNIGGVTMGPSTGIYLRDLSIDANYNTESFTWVGQPDQRKYYGISTFEIIVRGTFISHTRWPLAASPTAPTWPANSMPLQAPTGFGTVGGHAIPTTGTFSVTLRNNNALDILPVTSLGNHKFVFTSSSLQGSTGLLTTQFEGRLWATTNT